MRSSQDTPPRPGPPSWISDTAGALTAADVAAFDARIAGMHRDGLGRVAVAVVRSDDAGDTRRLAQRILRAWRIGDDPRTLPVGRVDAVLLLVAVSSPDGGACGVAAGGADTAQDFAEKAGERCNAAARAPLAAGQVSRAVGAGLTVIENQLREYAGLGQVQGTAPPKLEVSTAAQVGTALGVGSKWVLGGMAAFTLFALTIVAIQRRREMAHSRCETCGSLMTEAPEEVRAKTLSEAQQREQLIGNARHVVLACQCGQTRVQSFR